MLRLCFNQCIRSRVPPYICFSHWIEFFSWNTSCYQSKLGCIFHFMLLSKPFVMKYLSTHHLDLVLLEPSYSWQSYARDCVNNAGPRRLCGSVSDSAAVWILDAVLLLHFWSLVLPLVTSAPHVNLTAVNKVTVFDLICSKCLFSCALHVTLSVVILHSIRMHSWISPPVPPLKE